MPDQWDDTIARRYLDAYGDHPLQELWLEHVTLGPEDFLLDIGCGGGGAIRAALARVPDLRAVGIDPSKVMLAAAREAAPRADFYGASAEAIPLPGGVVTQALANCSLVHMSDIDAAVVEIARVMRKGGALLAISEAFAELDGDEGSISPGDLALIR